MKSLKFKDIAILITSFIGVMFFAYIWLSPNYNNGSNYNYLKNNFGQFTFFVFLMLFVYNFLKLVQKEKIFLTVIIISFIGILILYLSSKIFLWPFTIVLTISLLFFLSRKWINYKKR